LNHGTVLEEAHEDFSEKLSTLNQKNDAVQHETLLIPTRGAKISLQIG
jgi:hypothetical protein